MRLIDAHSHVNFNAYKDDADAVIRRSLEQGVGMFAVGSQSSTSERAVDFAEKYDGVWAVVGLHPIHLFSQDVDEAEIPYKSRAEKFDTDFYRGLARRSGKVVGIGECGLDYYHVPPNVSREEVIAKQQMTFRAHLDLALELGLPVMIHCRDGSTSLTTGAHADVAAILGEYAAKGKPLSGDVHCFTGTAAEAERYLQLGFFISFTGIITFPPRAADKAKVESLQDVVKIVPLERMLVETDAPYLAPVPFRGKRNEPAYVRYVAEKAAEIKGISIEEVEKQTLENTKQLFNL